MAGLQAQRAPLWLCGISVFLMWLLLSCCCEHNVGSIHVIMGGRLGACSGGHCKRLCL